MSANRPARAGFTIVELLIAITIFGIGILGVFALVQSSIAASARSRDTAVASQLVGERFELVRWFRDSNWVAGLSWTGSDATLPNTAKLIEIKSGSAGNMAIGSFGSGHWTAENSFADDSFGARFAKLAEPFSENPEDVIREKSYTPLYLDSRGRFTHDASGTPTPWHAYLRAERVEWPAGMARAALRVTAVAVKDDGGKPREWRASTIITDWKR